MLTSTGSSEQSRMVGTVCISEVELSGSAKDLIIKDLLIVILDYLMIIITIKHI